MNGGPETGTTSETDLTRGVVIGTQVRVHNSGDEFRSEEVVERRMIRKEKGIPRIGL